MFRFLIGVAAVVAALSLTIGTKPTGPICRCQPSKPCWPRTDEWDAFNASISGNLVRVNPLVHVCHDPTFDEEACNEVTSQASNAFGELSSQVVSKFSRFLMQICIRSNQCTTKNTGAVQLYGCTTGRTGWRRMKPAI
jgi:hypothetical protein